MSNMSDAIQNKTRVPLIFNTCMCQTCQTEFIFLFVVVRKVVTGHQMVAEGHSTVAEGWKLFEETGPADLSQFLWQLKGKTTLTVTTPPPSPLPMEVGEKDPMPSPSLVKKEQGSEEPGIVMIGGVRK